jgi:hypothetical protein
MIRKQLAWSEVAHRTTARTYHDSRASVGCLRAGRQARGQPGHSISASSATDWKAHMLRRLLHTDLPPGDGFGGQRRCGATTPHNQASLASCEKHELVAGQELWRW